MTKVSVRTLQAMKRSGEKIASLTAYDAGFARLLERAGVEVLLVGDSLGMVVQGRDSTLAVTMEDMEYHTRCVARVARDALVVADMPFASCGTPERALDNAARLMRAGARMVKLEGAGAMIEAVARLTEHGIPVCGHLGLQPQSVHKLGGYRVQGRERAQAQAMRRDAEALQEAGADLLVLECVPSEPAAAIAGHLRIPVIGIGAGPSCDGQVLVLHDMLGVTPEPLPRFCRSFAAGAADLGAAVREFVRQVKEGEFPAPEHEYSNRPDPSAAGE
jgi:3-methyl-2-oxobutanoate hydroxymethyltransferase